MCENDLRERLRALQAVWLLALENEAANLKPDYHIDSQHIFWDTHRTSLVRCIGQAQKTIELMDDPDNFQDAIAFTPACESCGSPLLSGRCTVCVGCLPAETVPPVQPSDPQAEPQLYESLVDAARNLAAETDAARNVLNIFCTPTLLDLLSSPSALDSLPSDPQPEQPIPFTFREFL